MFLRGHSRVKNGSIFDPPVNKNISKAAMALVLVTLLAYSVYTKQQSLQGKKAVILDQLYGENLEFGFTERCILMLESEGYRVSVYRGENVTAELFHDLDWGSDIVILRVHSGVFDGGTWLFPHEKYDSSKYVLEQLGGEVNIGRCGSLDYPVFAVSCAFFEDSVESRSGLVVLMGCNGLEKNDLCEVMYRDGIGAVVGWSGSVTVEETDEVVFEFLVSMISGEDLAADDDTGLSIFPVNASGFKLG
jgi:hypothetical protein